MSETCAICLELLSNNSLDFFKSHCNHCFHGSCIIKHVIHNNAECPMCRVNLTKEDTIPISRTNPPSPNTSSPNTSSPNTSSPNTSSPHLYELQTPPPLINPILLPPIIPSLQIRPNYIIHQSTRRNLESRFNETLSNLINSDQTISYLI